MVSLLAPLLILTMGATGADAPVGVGPQPSPTPISWELEFSFLDPKRIEVQLPGHAQPEVYWYMVYTVTNKSRTSQRFFPMFEIVTEDLRVYETDFDISPLVFDAIRERHRVTHPYLVSPTKAIGALLSGEDNARESVAIWRQVDLTQNNFTVYVAGLSGETRFMANPVYDPERPETVTTVLSGREREITVNPRFFTLRKTLEISYNLPGSPQSRRAAIPERTGVRWVMR
jgi:hypothetical protein